MSDKKAAVDSTKGLVTTRIVVMTWPSVTWIDTWLDTDGNGRPETYERRVKAPNVDENKFVDVGAPQPLDTKTLQWVWMPARPSTDSDDDEWEVHIDVQQGGVSLSGFPWKLRGKFPPGKRHGIWEASAGIEVA